MQEKIIENTPVVGINKTNEWHYTKIGGSVVDAGIFQDVDLLNCPKGFEEFDGMWLDYLMHSHGWFMGMIDVKPIFFDQKKIVHEKTGLKKTDHEETDHEKTEQDKTEHEETDKKKTDQVEPNQENTNAVENQQKTTSKTNLFLKYLQKRGFACKVRT